MAFIIPIFISIKSSIVPFWFSLSNNEPVVKSLDDTKPEVSTYRGIQNDISLKDDNKPSMM